MSKVGEIKARWAKATPGPWLVEREEQPLVCYDLEPDLTPEDGFPVRIGPIAFWEHEEDTGEQVESDASAIAAAPTDVSYLLGLVERLEAVAAASEALTLCEAHPRGALDCPGCLAEWTSLTDVECELERLDAYRREHGG